ncbi:tol protein [Fusarium fujikuroi]|nr:tol protein [Fusarium fujikuroi]
MPRCAFCCAFAIDQDHFYLEFHPNLASLKKSAGDGCDFCRLCWTGFQREWAGSEIETVLKGNVPEGVTKFEPGIWIYVHFTDYSPTLTQPRIIVSCGRYNPITSVKESSHGLSYINLAVYGKEGTAAGSRTPGRICTPEYEPDSYLTLIRRFLERCTNSHQACGADATYEMPTRVIDVGNAKQGDLPRLVVTGQSMKEKYLALSYCWGPGTDTFTLNHRTMEGMLKGIDESRLVAAHRDTIALARQLGIRYIWIDALCIIQGDKDDWERESKLMAKVYGHATLTITAGRSGDARNSFIANTYKQSAPCCEFPLGDGLGGNVIVGPLRSTDYGVTETRGWCCQEKRLSRRVVFFGREQLFFLCRSSGYSEDRSYQEGKSVLLHSFLKNGNGNQQLIQDRLLQYWDEIVVDFSRRQLSNPHDIFAALASIAEPISKALQSRYLAGLWEDDLVRCLLWRPGYRVSSFFGPATRPLPTIFAPAPVIRAPSWSWASIQGGVKPLTLQQFRRMKTESQSGTPLIRPKQGRWTVDPHCGADALHMPSCELQLLGQVQQAIVLTRTPSSEFIASLRKQKRPAGTMRRPVVLGRKELKGGSLNKDMTTFVALGIFDFDEEGIDEVWCLQLTLEEGLMLCKKGDKTFQRTGVFQVCKLDWFDSVAESEVRLV